MVPILLPKDLKRLFEDIMTVFKEIFLDRILNDVVIESEYGYKFLCEELDFLEDSFEQLFEKKLDIPIGMIRQSTKLIEKKKYNSFMSNN